MENMRAKSMEKIILFFERTLVLLIESFICFTKYNKHWLQFYNEKHCRIFV